MIQRRNGMYRFKKFKPVLGILLAVFILTGCASGKAMIEEPKQTDVAKSAESETAAAESAVNDSASVEQSERKTIRLIVTSDLHGKMVPWDYVTNEESPNGSLAQVASVIKEKRNDNTFVIDVGDVIQDNSSELFLDEPVHPMIQGMNAIGYDICTTGNHEYNFGMDEVRKVIASHKAKVVLSNVYDKNGERLADPYVIEERDGVKIGFIGAVTPNITKWDRTKLQGYTVTDPADEVNDAIKEIKDKADIIVGVLHMDMRSELGTPNSGIEEIMKKCPELDFICAGHGHNEIPGGDGTPIPVVENKNQGQTVMVSDLNLIKKDGKWEVESTSTESVYTADYEPDSKIVDLLKQYDRFARDNAEMIIGQLELGDISDPCDVPGTPNKFFSDSAVLDFVNIVIKHYTGADIAARAPSRINEEIKQGPISKSDLAKHYRYTNDIITLKMNGKQLKKWMEYNACYYNQVKPGDLTISFDETIAFYKFVVFSGVNYEINVSKPEWERIENLTWSDGRPVEDEDVFTLATTGYITDTVLTVPGVLFEADEEMPEIISREITHDSFYGPNDVRTMMTEYISFEKNGVITPEKYDNWRITGFNPDKEKQKKAIELIKAGKLKVESENTDKYLNNKSVTEDMLKEFE